MAKSIEFLYGGTFQIPVVEFDVGVSRDSLRDISRNDVPEFCFLG